MQWVLLGRVDPLSSYFEDTGITEFREGEIRDLPTSLCTELIYYTQDCLSISRKKQVSVYDTWCSARVPLTFTSPLLDSCNSLPEAIFVRAHWAHTPGKPGVLDS